MPVYLLQGLILGATAAAQPGPFQAYLLSLIARDGWRRAIPASFAPLLSDWPILVLVLLVLTRMPEWLLFALQVVGGLFLLYLAWTAWRTLKQVSNMPDIAVPPVTGQIKTNIGRAAIMNLLSPSPYIFWATVAGPILIEGWRQSPVFGLAFLLSFYFALIGGLTLFVVLFAGASKLDPRVNRALAVVSAVALFAFGLYQLMTGLNGARAALT